MKPFHKPALLPQLTRSFFVGVLDKSTLVDRAGLFVVFPNISSLDQTHVRLVEHI
jgi:hypothetical protein